MFGCLGFVVGFWLLFGLFFVGLCFVCCLDFVVDFCVLFELVGFGVLVWVSLVVCMVDLFGLWVVMLLFGCLVWVFVCVWVVVCLF